MNRRHPLDRIVYPVAGIITLIVFIIRAVS